MMIDSISVHIHPNEVLILAPTGQDAHLIESTLKQSGIDASPYLNAESVCERMKNDAGVLLIAEEALNIKAVTALKRCLASQEPWSDIPVIVLTSSGETTLNSLRVMETFSINGNVTLMERPFRRITLISMLQAALRSRTRQYQVRELLKIQIEATQMRDEFISIASHELKTPITSLKLQTQLNQRLLEKQAVSFTPERIQKLIEVTDKQVNRLARLVEDMLDISRVNTGKLAMDKVEADLSSLVKEVVDGMGAQIQLAKCNLTLDLSPSLCVFIDRYRIEQVITNLITNALRYAAGKPFSIRTQKQNGNACLIVQDQGPGIALENQDRIFERFERAVSSDNISGLGLGLYICKEIVEAHYGKIHVESDSKNGSAFIVEIPLFDKD
jgi:signal transduction histidine kinase